jgi:hypothetical protein
MNTSSLAQTNTLASIFAASEHQPTQIRMAGRCLFL